MWIAKSLFFILTAVTAAVFIYYATLREEPIKVGILHSLSGTMKISEKALVDAWLLAIEEINAGGGLLGRTVVPVIADGASDEEVFAREAKRLIHTEKVDVIFGCWTSASRKSVKSVVEASENILVYPVQYEGLESSANIIYLGAVPNQQIVPAVYWAMKQLGPRMYLVGSDYIFPKAANEIIRHHLQLLEGEAVAETYVPLGATDFERIASEIKAFSPDVIVNTLNGESNIHFFKALHKAGVTPDKIPSISFSIGENELQDLRLKGGDELFEAMAGHYASWNYFQTIPSQRNRAFVQTFKKRFGKARVVSNPMIDAYTGVHLWAQAVKDANSPRPKEVLKAIKKQSIAALDGAVYVDPQNNHIWKTVRIAKVRSDGQFDVVWSSQHPVRPIPYPLYRDVTEWEGYLQGLYEGWGNRWSAPLVK